MRRGNPWTSGFDLLRNPRACSIRCVSTTMILRLRSGQVYTHVFNKGGKGVVSPLDTVLG
jgi:hypothetical protein